MLDSMVSLLDAASAQLEQDHINQLAEKKLQLKAPHCQGTTRGQTIINNKILLKIMKKIISLRQCYINGYSLFYVQLLNMKSLLLSNCDHCWCCSKIYTDPLAFLFHMGANRGI